jgi:hypothetical protein
VILVRQVAHQCCGKLGKLQGYFSPKSKATEPSVYYLLNDLAFARRHLVQGRLSAPKQGFLPLH